MKFVPLVENHKQRPKQQSPGIRFLNAKLLSQHRCLGREKLKKEVSMPVDYPVSRLKQDVRVMSPINTPIINMPNKARCHVLPYPSSALSHLPVRPPVVVLYAVIWSSLITKICEQIMKFYYISQAATRKHVVSPKILGGGVKKELKDTKRYVPYSQ
jgi:hypothetical protein